MRQLAYTTLRLAPLLLLEQYQLAIHALTLLPITPASLTLICISQLPHVMASSEATCSVAAAETLSTLVVLAWTKYVARLDTTEPDISTENIYTVTGGTDTHNKFCIQTVNIQGGIKDADKIIAIQNPCDT
jgi:hypothetical protein